MIRPPAAERGFVLALIASAAVHAALLPLFLSFASGAALMHVRPVEGSFITAFLVPGTPALAAKPSSLPAFRPEHSVRTEMAPAVSAGASPEKAQQTDQEDKKPNPDIRRVAELAGTEHDAPGSPEKASPLALAVVVPEGRGSTGIGGTGIPAGREIGGASSRQDDAGNGAPQRKEAGNGREGSGASSPKDADAIPRYGDNDVPTYPLLARLRGYQGMAVLSVEVLADGRVGQVGLSRSTGHEILDRTAMETVRSWKFEPGRREGRPVAMSVAVPVRFVLKGDSTLVKMDDRR